MRISRLASLTALAVALFAASSARANFDYTVAPNPSFTFNGGSQGGSLDDGGQATLLAGPNVSGTNQGLSTDIVIATPGFTTTDTGPAKPLSFNFSYDISITNPTGAVPDNFNTGIFTFSGVIAASKANNNVSNFRVTDFVDSSASNPNSGGNPQTIGGQVFTLSVLGTSPATPGQNVNGTNPPSAAGNAFGNAGSLTVHVEVTAVPEPASIALMGIGGIGALTLFRRRKVQA